MSICSKRKNTAQPIMLNAPVYFLPIRSINSIFIGSAEKKRHYVEIITYWMLPCTFFLYDLLIAYLLAVLKKRHYVAIITYWMLPCTSFLYDLLITYLLAELKKTPLCWNHYILNDPVYFLPIRSINNIFIGSAEKTHYVAIITYLLYNKSIRTNLIVFV